ncbi:acyl carrier protein [Corynebacterium sp. MSK041]|uniref:acyl carrier protein n=1 Tax=Corynebacterium sp. MSK041 TaxID=3050194 RepID=UPI00254DFCEB|nr:acyl carrier protein [Corynebacterium sp. MSK041]MDK8794188.1 acyl carrier protein [Corynebacterium sp. MSK041]
MELSQRLDLAKFGFDAPASEPEEQTVPRDGDAFAQLCALLSKVGVVEDAQSISPADTLDGLDVDSLTQIEFVVRAEDHFGVRIDEELFSSWDTLGDMAEYLAGAE